MREYIINKHKGLDKSNNLFNKEMEYAEDILNGYVDISPKYKAQITQRPGLTKQTASALGSGDKIRYLKKHKWKNGTSEFICRGNDGWYYVSAGAYVALDVGRTDDAKGQSCAYDDNFVMTDGGKARKSNAAHTASDLSSDAAQPAASSACHTHRNRVILNEVGTMIVHASKVADPFGATAFSAASDYWYVDLSLYLPEWDEPKAFGTIADYVLVVYGSKYVTYISLPETYADITLLSYKELFPLSPYGQQSIGNDVAVSLAGGLNSLASTNAYERLRADDLSNYIAQYWKDLIDIENDVDSICSVRNTKLGQMYITFHGENETNTLVYGLAAKNFIGRYQFHVAPYSWDEADGDEIYMGGDDGHIYKLDDASYSDDGNAIEFSWQPVFLGGDDPGSFKGPREAEIIGHTNSPVTLYLDFWFDNSDYEMQTVDFELDAVVSRFRESKFRESYYRGVGRDMILNPNMINRGKFIGLRLRHSQLGVRVKIPFLRLKYLVEGVK